MRKGIGPFSILLIGMFGLIMVSGVVFISFFNRSNISKRAAMEVNIIDGINKVELSKISLTQSLKNSFYQSSYLVSDQGGYYNLEKTDCYDCIPYWRIYDSIEFPEYEKNLETTTLHFFNKYAKSFKGEVDIPEYNSVDLSGSSGKTTIKAVAAEALGLKRPMVEINEGLEIVADAEPRTLRLFEIGKKEFLDDDILGKKIPDSATYNEAMDKIHNLGGELNEGIPGKTGYNSEDIEIRLTPSKIYVLDGDESKFALRYLVEITDNSQEYPVYDYLTKKTDYKKIGLKFYVVVGNYEFEPDKNTCQIKESITEMSIIPGTNCYCMDSSCTDSCSWSASGVNKCPDLACRSNGVPGELVSCPGLASPHVNKYNSYKDTIVSAISTEGLTDYIPLEEATYLVAAVITQESNWNQFTTCSASSGCGIMQVTLSSAKGCDGIGSWEELSTSAGLNIRCGVRILKSKLSSMGSYNNYDFENLIKLGLASYNGGQATIQEAIKIAGDSKWESMNNMQVMTDACKAMCEKYNVYCNDPGGKAKIILRYVDDTVYPGYQDWKRCQKKEVTTTTTTIGGSLDIIDHPADSSKYDSTRWETIIDRVVIHYTARDIGPTLDTLADDKNRKASVHYVVDRDGTIYRLVDEKYSAWHAGCTKTQSDPNCIEGMNPRSIGIEVVNYGYLCDDKLGVNSDRCKFLAHALRGNTDYWEAYPEEQMNSLIGLVSDIIRRNSGITVDRTHIIGHDEVTSGKFDPGPAFDWNDFISRLG